MKIPGLFPPTTAERTGGAQNNPFRIKLRILDRKMAAVYGQELYEWKWRASLFATSMASLAAIAASLQLGFEHWYAFVPTALAFLMIAGGPLLRHTELRGHAITAYLMEALYGWDYEQALEFNAENMVRFYQSSFSDRARVADEMRALRGWAQDWYRANERKVHVVFDFGLKHGPAK